MRRKGHHRERVAPSAPNGKQKAFDRKNLARGKSIDLFLRHGSISAVVRLLSVCLCLVVLKLLDAVSRSGAKRFIKPGKTDCTHTHNTCGGESSILGSVERTCCMRSYSRMRAPLFLRNLMKGNRPTDMLRFSHKIWIKCLT